VVGVGFDRDTLLEAGIHDAYAFAAVSSGDNSNILAARVARETFGVAKVVARIYDPGRAEVYQRLGIPTVATVPWTADQMARRLLPVDATPEFRDASGTLVLAEVQVHLGWVGRRMASLDEATRGRVAYLTRLGEGLVPGPDTVYQEGDLVHIVVREDELGDAERVLTAAPPQERA
jgi:trk system potassium uptake protein TrkA